ncbi:N-acylglucosamine 2-epimerase [Flammeovirgaceae bacterium 311]|nr:N-acylglucosamine 2-epimerase [Flammeovirgaceae bacterium 311]
MPAYAQQEDRKKIAREMEYSIKRELLNKWYPKAIDRQHGGFLSTFTYDFKPTGPQDKMIVTQARHTWANAKAAVLYPEVNYYKDGAVHGFKFLKDVMWDKQHGGFYTLVDRQGDPKGAAGEQKSAYGNSFGIYALTAHYIATGDTSALNLAKRTFYWLETYSHDPKHRGYFQHLQRNGAVIERTPELPSTSDVGYKDHNSSIHLLEAFTDLYQVWPDSLLRLRLKEMLVLVRDTITNNEGYMQLFFQPDWTPVTFRDSSEAAILKHRYLDHVSFGHDVETAYLMLEASHVLGLKNDTLTMAVAKKMVDHSLRNGWDNQLGGFYDEGYYFADKPGMSIIKDGKNWWSQAEGLNSLLLMADHFPEDEMDYFGKFQQLWEYCQHYLIDHVYGDWYQGGLDKEPEQKTALKGQIWKANYHQLRALINCVQRLQPDTTAPSSPARLYAAPKNNMLVLNWVKARDDRKLLGYNIYQNDKKIGFTPLTSFAVKHAKPGRKNTYLVKAVDYQGNESGAGKAVMY